MTTDRVFIQDLEQIKAFIALQRSKDEYFDHIMDRIMRKTSHV